MSRRNKKGRGNGKNGAGERCGGSVSRGNDGGKGLERYPELKRFGGGWHSWRRCLSVRGIGGCRKRELFPLVVEGRDRAVRKHAVLNDPEMGCS
jgi:hypothetical protein